MIRSVLAVFLLISGTLLAAIDDYVVADKASVEAFFGTSEVKVVFVYETPDKKRSVYLVDFSLDIIKPVQLTQVASDHVSDVQISPDGSLIVYNDSPGLDDLSFLKQPGKSMTAKITRTVPGAAVHAVSGYVNIARWANDEQSPTLIYGTCTEQTSDLAHLGCGKTMKQPVSAEGIPGEAVVFYDGGSFNGNVSADGKYISTFEVSHNGISEANSAYMYSFEAGTSTKINGLPFEPKLFIQQCNVSHSPSKEHTNLALSFHFSYNNNAGIWEPYPKGFKTHEILFIGDHLGNIVHHFFVPGDQFGNNFPDRCLEDFFNCRGETIATVWEDPEYSTHGNFLVSAQAFDRFRTDVSGTDPELVNNIPYQEKVVAVKISDGSYHNLVEDSDTVSFATPAQLKWPHMWVSDAASSVRPRGFSSPASFGSVKLHGTTVSANEAISRVTIFDLNGRLLVSAQPKGVSAKMVSLADEQLQSTGASVLRVEFVSGGAQVIKLTPQL